MPVIKDYRQQTSAPGPIQRVEYSADMFGAAEGRALVGAGGAVLGAAETIAKRLDQENTSDITRKVTKANADLAIDLRETIDSAVPGDKKVFEDYNKRVEETLGKIGEGAETSGAREFFGEASERIKGQLHKTARDGQSELAGMKAVQDYSEGLNNLSAATVADPSSQALQFQMHAAMVENLAASGQLPRHKALELRADGEKALAKASVRGWSQLNPEYAQAKLKSGEFDKYLGAEGKLQLQGEIEQAVRGKEVDAERRRIEQRRILEDKQRGVKNDFLTAIQENKLDWKQIQNSILEPESKEHYLNLLEKKNSPEERLKTDPATMIALFNRINLPDGDPNKIVNEEQLDRYAGNGLSFPDLNRLRDEFQGKNTQAGQIESDLKKQLFEIARGKLTKSNPMLGFKDPVGDEQMQRFMVNFMDDYKEQRAKGVSSKELLSPDSPKYLGNIISNYTRSPQQIMRSLVQRQRPSTSLMPGVPQAGAAPLPRQPGESPAAYLKRKKENK